MLFKQHYTKLLLGLKNQAREGKNEKILYHCKGTNKDVQDSCEDVIFLKNCFVSKNF